MKRRLMVSVIAICLGFSMVSCGNVQTSNEEATTETVTEETSENGTEEITSEATEVTVNSEEETDSGVTIIYGEIIDDSSNS